MNVDINSLQERLREHRVQHHVGEAVRGALPGAGPRYHPNPYLQHLYRQRQAGVQAPATAQGNQNSVSLNIDPTDLEILMNEMEAGLAPQASGSDGHSHDQREHGSHGHTHAHQEQALQFDWKILMSSGAFVVILFLHVMADHILGLLIFLGLFCILTYANKRMIEIVHLASLREGENKNIVWMCLQLIVFLALHIALMYWVFFQEQQLWRVLYFQLPLGWSGDIFDLFWVTMVTDYTLKALTVILKLALTLVPYFILSKKKRGRCYMFVEVLLQTYRAVVPIVPWTHFLFDKPKTGRLIFSGILVVLYIICKGIELRGFLIQLKKSLVSLTKDSNFGTTPSNADMAARDEVCPICQDDYQDPIMLSCKHVFCENCVSVWFDREKTCPMCRTQIQSDRPYYQDGSTAQHLQWY